MFAPFPMSAAWRHLGAREGFEICTFSLIDGDSGAGWRIAGETAAVDGDDTWVIRYEMSVDAQWTARARITRQGSDGERATILEGDGLGHWTVNGRPVPGLDGCRDIDLESSAMTNTFPVHRMNLATGQQSVAPAAYVRADLSVERLDQTYRRLLGEVGTGHRYEYRAPVFDFACELTYDLAGLVSNYPGIAVRSG